MGFNKKELSKATANLDARKAPSKPRDIIYDPAGQWKHPGQPTRIPGGNVTMQGVPYPVMAYPNVGQPQIMYPEQDYNFAGADYVDEYPQMKRGGSKKFSRDITATNVLFTKNPYLKKKKSKKKKIFDPNAQYFQYGGQPTNIQDEPDVIYTPSMEMSSGGMTHYKEGGKLGPIPINSGRKVLRDWTYGESIGMLQEDDGGYIETELTPEEIEVYRKGGYVVEEVDKFQKGGTKTHKSKDGTVTNTIQNPDGTQTIQVKTKDGKYFEKTTPVNYEKQLDKLKQEYKDEKDYEKLLNYAGVLAYPAAIVSSAIDASNENYGDAAVGLIPFIGKQARGSQLLRRNAYTGLINSGIKHATAKYVRPAIDYTTKGLGIGSAAYDLSKQEGGPIETELTPEEIEWYKSQGYEVEELD